MLEFIVFFGAWRLGLGWRRSKIPGPSLVEEAEFQVTLWGWEVDTSCHPMEFTKEHKTKKTEGWQKQQEMIPLFYKTNTITTNKANHSRVFANSGKRTCKEKNLIKSCTKIQDFLQDVLCFRIFGHRGTFFCIVILGTFEPLPGQNFLTPKLRVHNSTSLKIYQDSVINDENYGKFHGNS